MAFDRSLRRIAHRTAVSNLYASCLPKERALFSVHPDIGDGLGMFLENTRLSDMPIGALGNMYTGFIAADDSDITEDEAITVFPSDRIINLPIHFISRGNPIVVSAGGERVHDRQAPVSIDHHETFTLIGWGGEMIRRFPDNFYGGAEFTEHCCLPNAFLNHAKVEKGAGMCPFTLSGSFDLPHFIDCNDGSGNRFHFDRFEYSFAPFFLHLTQKIEVGGRYSLFFCYNLSSRFSSMLSLFFDANSFFH
jgi:hypothetical protein